jgi:hypothetical protein
VTAIFSVDELAGNANTGTGFAHASFQDKVDAETLRDFLHVHVLALVGEGGVARYDKETRHFRQISNDVFGDAVTEVFLLRVAAHVDEWKNSYRRPFLPGRCCAICGGMLD